MPTNILLITADDMDGMTPGAFGGHGGVTPAIDRLATEGMVFRRAHVAAAVCQPSRSAIMTGLWPHRNGAEGFEPIDDDVPLLTDLLRGVGYLVGILGKVNHLQPVERFGWDLNQGIRDLGMGRDPKRYGAAARDFLRRAQDEGRPWFLMANAHDPHRPFYRSDQEVEKFTPDERSQIPAPSREFSAEDAGALPGFLPELADVRREYAEYLSSSRRCDDVVAEVLSAVEEAGAVDDTLVVFLSDNGMAFPFAKANCYLRSTVTPLVVRWPGRVAAGAVEAEAFVSGLDLFPTFCLAAGVDCPEDVDGRSLLPIFEQRAGLQRDAVVTVFHETSAQRRFEMRCVQTADLGYVWNAWAGTGEEYVAENMEGRTWQAMVAASADDAGIAARVAFYRSRCPEELYDLATDPDCLLNLAEQGAHADRLQQMRERLGAWMADRGDPLAERYTREHLRS